MNSQFQNVKDRSERIIAKSTRPDKQIVLAALLETWSRLDAQGIRAIDFADVAVLVAEGAMLSYESLEEAEAFGEHLKVSGSTLIRCVRDHWPPVDPDDWPEDWPDTLRE